MRTIYYGRTKRVRVKNIRSGEKRTALESRLFNDLVLTLIDYIQPVQLNAQLIAKLDCLYSFATVSQRQRYAKPRIRGFELNMKRKTPRYRTTTSFGGGIHC